MVNDMKRIELTNFGESLRSLESNLRLRAVLLFLLIFIPLPLLAQKNKPKDQPKIILAQPFGVTPGKTVKVVLRGLKLDTAKEVSLAPKGTVKLLKKSKVAVPQQMEASRVGDTQIEAEVTLPADIAGETVEVTVVTADNSTVTHKLPIDRISFVAEKEPNESFKQAQVVKIGQSVEGNISRAQDVDVFRLEAKVGEKLVIEVFAARLGSALDSFLTLYDADGQVVVTCDDIEGSTDSRIEVTIAKAGSYLLSLTDAHDQGGTLHPYRLVIRSR